MPSPRVASAVPLLLAAGLVAGCGNSGSTTAGTSPVALDDPAPGEDQASAVGDGASTRLAADLSGAAVVPGPGDADGQGSATVVVEPGSSQLCYRIDVRAVADVDGTSLHEGPAGRRGEVLLGLDPPENGSAEGCVTAEPALLDRVERSPERYYLNVRSAGHPDGAVRGQLVPA